MATRDFDSRALAARVAALALVCAAVAAQPPPPPPTVQTPCGTYEGVWRNDTTPATAHFLGVRFAAAPARWRHSAAPACDPSAYFVARVQAPACVQDSQEREPLQQEDCLFLNIAVAPAAQLPAPGAPPPGAGALAPVLVFWHGGDLTFGSPSWYDEAVAAAAFAGDAAAGTGGPVVIVSPAYRLNVVGYLATADLAAEQGGTAGNYGLGDQLAALRWVQANVGFFAGDATRVTISGQSSGGTSVYGLLSGAGSRGLFAAAISISGSENSSFVPARKFAQDAAFVASVGCGSGATSAARVACMRDLPVGALANDTPPPWDNSPVQELPAVGPAGFGLPAIIYGDGLLAQLPLAAALRAGLVDVPLLMMHTAQELEMQPTWDVRALSPAQWAASLAGNMSAWGAAAAADVAAAYEFESSISPQLAMSSIAADLMTTCAMPGLVADALGAPGAARTAPIYALMGNAWPGASAGYPTFTVGYSTRYSMHMFDLIAAWRQWDFMARFTNGSQPEYAPTPGDEAYGAATRATWYALMSEPGKAPPGLLPVNAVPGFPAHYNMFVQGNGSATPGVGANVVDWRKDKCDLWAALAVDVRAFWWSN